MAKKKKREEQQESKLISQKAINDQINEAKQANKKKVELVIDHYITVIFMTLITIYALFFDDLRILLFPKD